MRSALKIPQTAFPPLAPIGALQWTVERRRLRKKSHTAQIVVRGPNTNSDSAHDQCVPPKFKFDFASAKDDQPFFICRFTIICSVYLSLSVRFRIIAFYSH